MIGIREHGVQTGFRRYIDLGWTLTCAELDSVWFFHDPSLPELEAPSPGSSPACAVIAWEDAVSVRVKLTTIGPPYMK